MVWHGARPPALAVIRLEIGPTREVQTAVGKECDLRHGEGVAVCRVPPSSLLYCACSRPNVKLKRIYYSLH